MADQALLDRLKRYSMKCLTERTDGDFAEAVWESVEVIDGLLNDLQEALDTIEELQKPKWIPVSERLPEENKPVVATYWHENKRYSLIMLLGEFTWFRPTHWFYLPEPPKE